MSSTLSALLAAITEIDFSLLQEGYSIGLDWLGKFARAIIEGVGILGVGIIVFTLVLKAITLPFDIYQRVNSRKQSMLMRQMQPELEKLQQQYANDKEMYNRKMMEVYKKNGYHMMAACLPMIISLVILIVAFQGFRVYSQYGNLKMYVDMSNQYNAAILHYAPLGVDYKLSAENENDNVISWEGDTYTDAENNIVYTLKNVEKTEQEGGSKTERFLEVRSTDESKYIYYQYSLESNGEKEYFIDGERLQKADGDGLKTFETEDVDFSTACKKYVIHIGADAAASWYRDNGAHFLWIKNVWYPDVSYAHPIQSYANFMKNFSNVKVTFENGEQKELANVFNEANYNNLISELKDETTKANGYFILIVLSIGLMVLSQFVTMRSQKEMNKYQSVDGSGMKQQKIMMIMMPLIYAVFAFMYSAAFSIYMVMSSAISIIVTLLSNLIIGAIFKKKEAKVQEERQVRKLPWMKDEPQQTDKKQRNTKNKKK